MRHFGHCRALVVLLSLLALTPEGVLAAETPEGVRAAEPRAPSPSWPEVERLVAARELEAAAAVVAELLAAARARGDEAEWTRALVRATQLRQSLQGYERAVRQLQEEPWPEGELARAVVGLYYARSLVRYHQVYAWEIGRRERLEPEVAETGTDLRSWTREQILAAALDAYGKVWDRRAALGGTPVADLGEYLIPNDYPAGVRGTLRDAVSYLLAGLLADSSFWSPRESNETFQLDVAALVRGPGAAAARPSDSAAHPLVRLAAVLVDLEEWHDTYGRREAALEARLERLRQLHGALGAAADRRLIRQELESALPAWRDLPWWAMGMATLAEFTREPAEPGQPPGNLARAREIARQGPRPFRTRSAASAASPSPGPSRRRTTTSPPWRATGRWRSLRRSLRVEHKNLAALFFRAFAVDPWQRTGEGLPPFPDRTEVQALLRDAPAAAWRTDLAPTPDFATHATLGRPAARRRRLLC